MIVQAVCLLDDLDKELNNYIMRCREWYGWHFPELGKIITDNIVFVKTVRIIGKCIVVAEVAWYHKVLYNNNKPVEFHSLHPVACHDI